MRRASQFALRALSLLCAATFPCGAAAELRPISTRNAYNGGRVIAEGQQLIDRIVARVNTDVILLSDIRALSRYQQLVEGKSETDAQILDRLVDQWIVHNEAQVAQFPPPKDEAIDHAAERLRQSFQTPQEYDARRKQVGLSEPEVRAMLASQLYLSGYLDSRFRPSVQITDKEIEDFYQNALIPRAKARGQAPPSLEAARNQIHEALVEKGINDQAERWIDESRARVHVQKMLDEDAK